MRKLAVIFVALTFVLTGSIAYAGQFGPPEPAAWEGKVSLGLGYFYSSAKWKPNNTAENTEKVKRNETYLQGSYGFIKDGEVYFRLGGADIKIDNYFDYDNAPKPKDFKGDMKPFGALGIKGLLFARPSFGIGPFIQANLYSSYKDEKTLRELGFSDTGIVRTKFKNIWDINIGVSAQAKIGEIVLYGGPVGYWHRAKVEEEAQNLTTGTTYKASDTYKEKNNIGGFAGLKVPLGKGLGIEVEGQYKSEFSMGGALTYAF